MYIVVASQRSIMRRMTHHSMIVKLIPCKLRNFASSFALNWPRNKLQAKFESCCAPSSSAEASSENIEGVPCEQGDTLEVEERELHNVGLERKPKKGEEVELECERLAFKGMGVCRLPSGFVVLCERALPGERLIARITKRRRGYAEAYKVATLEPHRGAVEAPCPHFPSCGGCTLQSLSYSGQLAAKQEQVQDFFVKMAGVPPSQLPLIMRPILPCQQQYHYRNKMEFSFGTRVWHVERPASPSPSPSPTPSPPDWGLPPPPIPLEGEGPKFVGGRGRRFSPNPKEFALGLHAPKRFDKVLPISTCLLQHPLANEVLTAVREYCQVNSETLPAYDPLTHEGFMRHLLIRTGSEPSSGAPTLSVNLVTKSSAVHLLSPLVDKILSAVPQVVSVVNTVNPSLSDSWTASYSQALSRENGGGEVGGEVGGKEGEERPQVHVLFGPERIEESLRGKIFEISPASFFQTNTGQAEELYALVEEACQLSGESQEIVLDLFCGTGTIGLSLASKVKHVYGFELVPSAVADAELNKRRNGISNATFFQGDLNKLTDAFGEHLPPPDVIIVDPNRPGLHLKLVNFLRQSSARRFVYVSCNPSTCARDVALLSRGEGEGALPGETEGKLKGRPFKLVSVQPVDMFPQTFHVECVVAMER